MPQLATAAVGSALGGPFYAEARNHQCGEGTILMDIPTLHAATKLSVLAKFLHDVSFMHKR